MKKLLLALLILSTISLSAGVIYRQQEKKLSAIPTYQVVQGGTSTSTKPTMGQILIGNSIGTYSLNTLTAGSNISITNATNSITIAASGITPFAWTPGSEGNSTSTRLIFGNGFISQASSTVSNSLQVAGLLQASSSLSVGGGTSLGSTLSATGVITFTNLSSGLVANNSGVLYSTATSSASCSGVVSCSGFTVVGSVSPTITSSSDLFAWTPTAYGNSTSSIIGFTGGLMSMASSTFSSTLFTSGLATINGGMLVTASSTINASVFDTSASTMIYRAYPSLSFATSTISSTTAQFIGNAAVKQTWAFADCYSASGQIVAIQFLNGTGNLDYILATGTSITRKTFTVNNNFSQGSTIQFTASSTASYRIAC